MIISSRRSPIIDGKIYLPDWARAPLSIQEGDLLHALWEPSADGTYVDLNFSQFEPKHWGDIWRMEIETEDRIGFYHRLFHYLVDSGILVLASEGTVVDRGENNAMSFIFSCVNYKSENDSSSSVRRAKDYVVVRDLVEDISINFIDQLLFSDNGLPRLKIRRIDSYHRLHNRATESHASVHALTFSQGALDLGDELVSSLSSTAPYTRQSFSSISVDTKDRLIRAIMFAEGPSAPQYVQVGVSNDPRSIFEVFSVFYRHNCNVIKLQIRPGLSKRYTVEKLLSSKDAVRLDITFVLQETGPQRGDLLADINDDLSRSQHLKLIGFELLTYEDFAK